MHVFPFPSPRVMYKPTSPLNNNITDTIGRALDNDRHEHEHEHEHEDEHAHEHEGNHRNDTTVLIQAVILAVIIAGLHVLRF